MGLIFACPVIQRQIRPLEVLDTKKEIQKENVSYEHAGYQIRVHFNGEKTLIQCIQNLTERKIAG